MLAYIQVKPSLDTGQATESTQISGHFNFPRWNDTKLPRYDTTHVTREEDQVIILPMKRTIIALIETSVSKCSIRPIGHEGGGGD